MSTPQYVYDGGKGRAKAAGVLHAEVFKTDPVQQYLLHSLPEQKRLDFFPEYFGALARASAKNNARFDEAWTREKTSDEEAPQCSAIWILAGNKFDSWKTYFSVDFLRVLFKVGIPGIRRMLGDFQAESNKAKAKYLVNQDGSKIKDYNYLFFVSTDPQERGKGLASTLIENFQTESAKKGLPIWLESTTEGSHRLYQRLGFKDTTSWILGKGEVDEDGHVKPGGNGVKMWAMLWMPDQEKS